MNMRCVSLLVVGVVVLTVYCLAGPAQCKEEAASEELTPQKRQQALEADVTQGALRVVKDDGQVVECPLKHTDVQADVAGFIARVTVTQTFYNPTKERIEAVYVFPLPHEAAVDEMTMVVGDRRVIGIIKRRAEARRIYEQALAAGQTTALLEQERPNIFTQSVGNIDPGQQVDIEISYVDVLRYDMGTYEFHFPMVVGPRFNPGGPISSPPATPKELQGKVSPPVPDTSRVPDASRISPPVLKPGMRTGHDVSLSIRLDAGVPIEELNVTNHEAEVQRDGASRASVTLSPADSLPNKDFVLRYDVVGQKPSMAMLAHTGQYNDTGRLGQGYFMMMIQPQEDQRLTKSPPREIVFLVDVSGSMSGQPTAKVVQSMQNMLKLCRPVDTVQVITFAGQAHSLFEKPVPVNDANIEKALNFTSGLRGGGGTHMLKGVKMAIDQPIDAERLRIVVMLTDGYIGNEAEIVEHVGKHCGDQIRFWAIGIGQSPNMHLIDGVARQGGGMGKKLGLNDDTVALTQEVMTRIQRAQLANIAIDWGGLQVGETYPTKIPELWAGRPVILLGRYRGDGGQATVTVKGTVEGEPTSWTLAVKLPAEQPNHDVLAKVWARRKIEDLMHQTYYQGSPAVEEMVTGIALDYRLMSQYTSFVAVDEESAGQLDEPAQPPRRMLVPVPLPEGTQWEGFFGPLDGEVDAERAVDRLAAGTFMKVEKQLARRENFALGAPRAFGLPSPAAPMQQMGRYGWSATRSRGSAPFPGLIANRSLRKSRMASSSRRQFSGRGMGMGGGFGGGAAPAPATNHLSLMVQPQVAFESLAEEPADEAKLAGVVLGPDAAKTLERATAALKAGQAAQKDGKLDRARSDLLKAFFLAQAAMARGNYNAGAVQSEAQAALVALHKQQVEAWTKQVPELNNQLDLVFRGEAIDAALGKIANAGDVRAELLSGSLDDAAALLLRDQVRVGYLDTRGVTVAQALDWLLHPLRLRWCVVDGKVVVGSERRLPGVSSWVYNAKAIAIPNPAELDKLKDQSEKAKKIMQECDALLNAIRTDVPADEQSVVWLTPGRLLVVADAATHAKLGQLLTELADPRAKVGGACGKLHGKTVARAKVAKPLQVKRREAIALLRLAEVHRHYGWQLVSAAAASRVDDEATTELRIAWNSPHTAKLVQDAPGVALRSLWAVCQAERLLPDDDALADLGAFRKLAALARAKATPAVEPALAALKKDAKDAAAFSAVAFAALALDDEQLTARALPLLTNDKSESSPAVRSVVAALLRDESTFDGDAMAKLLADGQIVGDELVALTALAARQAGGAAWTTFRADARSLLGNQPLSGAVVVLVNRL